MYVPGLPSIDRTHSKSNSSDPTLFPSSSTVSERAYSKEEEDISSSYLLGANSFVRKPVNFDALVQAVKTLGLFWLLLNERPPDRRHDT